MAHSADGIFNPCLLDQNEQIPAKIWELLRRSVTFRAVVKQLSELDTKERQFQETPGQYHGADWDKSWQLLNRVKNEHPFAGVALQWLVPEPLFHCQIATWPRGRKWKERGVFITRFLKAGRGLTPNVKDKSWAWSDPEKPNIEGCPIRRGPEVHLTKSRFKRLRSWVNPIWEWRRYKWPFTIEHAWPDSPAQFKREFQFIWRSQFDCRPVNPLTKDRTDSQYPYEVSFFHDWNLMSFRTSGEQGDNDLYQIVRFNEIRDNYRVFAIPKTILTKKSADAMGTWLASELKKGSGLYGDSLKTGLLNDGDMFGTRSEWNDWLPRHAGQPSRGIRDTHFYRRCKYMAALVDLVFPRFDIAGLLTRPAHRARGKKYVRK